MTNKDNDMTNKPKDMQRRYPYGFVSSLSKTRTFPIFGSSLISTTEREDGTLVIQIYRDYEDDLPVLSYLIYSEVFNGA